MIKKEKLIKNLISLNERISDWNDKEKQKKLKENYSENYNNLKRIIKIKAKYGNKSR